MSDTIEKRVKAVCRHCKEEGTIPFERHYPKRTALVETMCPDCGRGWHEIRFFDESGERLSVDPHQRKAEPITHGQSGENK